MSFLSCIIYTDKEAYEEPRQSLKTEIFEKIAKGFQLITIFHSESGRVPNTFYKIVVRKFPIYKLKQKTAKKLKLNYTTLLKG